MTEATLRTFIAFPIGERVVEKIGSLQKDLKPLKINAKMVDPKKIHLTLKFLGETPEQQLPSIITALNTIPLQPFTATLAHLGAFPTPVNPKVLWIGLEPQKPFNTLYNHINHALPSPAEKRFHPHITLARIKGPYDKKTVEHKLKTRIPPETFTIITFTLYQSTLAPQGPVYKELKTFPANL